MTLDELLALLIQAKAEHGGNVEVCILNHDSYYGSQSNDLRKVEIVKYSNGIVEVHLI